MQAMTESLREALYFVKGAKYIKAHMAHALMSVLLITAIALSFIYADI